ncbi:septal ring lytic transglycosylase RlpA family protein [Ensifer sp. 4252]|uniref:septal ring lytic transglycosylase RlpA family protein n=1 Tax=Ensifer sp. 4252 TaxID=3373915 RepID=UPI003D203C46
MAIDVSTAVKGVRWLAITMVCACCATCTTMQAPNTNRGKAYISEEVYGVKASPRVAFSKNVRKGGGRYMVGKPYVVKGKRYYPKEDLNYDRKGIASWYGSVFQGSRTANGEVYDQYHISAAHPTLPLPSYVRVTNLENGSSLIVRVNDRGPYRKGRIIDVSSKAADMLDLKHRGTASVRVQYVGRARLGGDDMPYLIASHVKKGDRFRAVNPEPQTATGVMVASDQSMADHLRSDSQSSWSKQTNHAGKTPSASYQTGTDAAAPFQTFEQVVMLPESATSTLNGRPKTHPSMSRNAKIAHQDHAIGSMPDNEVRRRIGMATGRDLVGRALADGLGGVAMVRDVTTLDVKYCLHEDSNDGARDICAVQVLPLPGVNRSQRLAGVISVRRRRANQSDCCWRGTTISLT